MAKPKNHNMQPSNKRSTDEWAQRFDELLLRERKIIFEIGDALIAAQEELTKKGFDEAIKKSGLMSRSNALNYMRVAKTEQLRKPEVQKHLPSGVGALINLAAWTPDEIDTAIKKRVLHPQSQRKSLEKWIDEKRRFEKIGKVEEWSPPSDAAPDAKVVGYVMASLDDFDREDVKKVDAAIQRLQKELPAFNFYFSRSNEYNSITGHRLNELSERIRTVYKEAPQLFVDPDFDKLLEAKTGYKTLEEKLFYLNYHVRDLAHILASADHKELHKRLKFTKAEWKFLGVDNPGHLTVLPFLQNEKQGPKTKITKQNKNKNKNKNE